MRAGAVISGAGHAALMALIVWGLPWFSPREREAVRVTEVSFVSEAEFTAAQAAAEAPRAPDAPPEQPAEQPAEPEAEPEVAAAELPEVVRGPGATPPPPAPEPEPAPAEALPSLAPVFDPQAPLGMATPDVAPVTPRVVTVAPPTAASPPQPRPVVRIAPDPVPPPPETARPAEEVVVAAAPTPAPEPEPAPEREPETAAAPPEAAAEPVAEASAPAELALITSSRPVPRRGNVAPVRTPEPAATPTPAPTQTAAASTPAPTPTPTPARPTPAADPQRDIQSAVAAAAAAAAGATAPTQPSVTAPSAPAATSLPMGTPLTGAERDGLKLAVQRCWNVPAGLRDAHELRVVVGAELGVDGNVISSSIRLVEPNPAPDPRFQQAYEAGRRALLRCAPYTSLPRDKFGQWRNIEVVFNPEGMVSW